MVPLSPKHTWHFHSRLVFIKAIESHLHCVGTKKKTFCDLKKNVSLHLSISQVSAQALRPVKLHYYYLLSAGLCTGNAVLINVLENKALRMKCKTQKGGMNI